MAIAAPSKTTPLWIAVFFKRINKNSKDLLISHPCKDNWEARWSHLEWSHSIMDQLSFKNKKQKTLHHIAFCTACYYLLLNSVKPVVEMGNMIENLSAREPLLLMWTCWSLSVCGAGEQWKSTSPNAVQSWSKVSHWNHGTVYWPTRDSMYKSQRVFCLFVLLCFAFASQRKSLHLITHLSSSQNKRSKQRILGAGK